MLEKLVFENSNKRYMKNGLDLFCYQISDGTVSDMQPIIQPNWHSDMEILYTEAELTLYIDNACYNATPGEVFFINPYTIHYAYRRSDGDILAIVFDPTILKTNKGNTTLDYRIDVLCAQELQFRAQLKKDSAFYHTLLPLIRSITAYKDTYISRDEDICCILAYLHQIMAECIRNDYFKRPCIKLEKSKQYVVKILNYINQNYEQSLTVRDIAAKFNLSTTYLYQLFRDHIGITPVHYINNVRITKSYTMLAQGINVTQTALNVGISDTSYYIKLFKKATGMTPYRWIQQKYHSIQEDTNNEHGY